jgi:flagellar hook protein FlgE
MSDSLLTGASGVDAAQQMLNVVGNNLANSNTVGFKAQTINFSDLVYETLGSATGSSHTLGGTDPKQVGLGVQVSDIETLNSQGSINSTGRELDVAMQGNGYFVARSSNGNLFTRDGSFGIDSSGFLVDPATGNRIQRFGTVGEGTATLPAFQSPGNDDILIPTNAQIPGHATTIVAMQGNLSAQANGPLAQVLTSAQPFTSAGVAATATTLLNSLDGLQSAYAPNDQLRLQGNDANGNPVNVTVPVDDTTTLGDLVNDIDSNFPGATASIDASGNLVVTATNPGPSTLNLAISDVAGNAGSMNWVAHDPAVTTTGANATTVQTSIQVYDTQGTPHNLNVTFTKQADGTWNLTAALNPSDGTLTSNTVTGITFNANGSFSATSGGNSIVAQFTGLAAPQSIAFNFGAPGAFNGLTQMGGNSAAAAVNQDGFAPGALNSLTFDQDGTINGNFSNGQTIPLAQLAIASFANADALTRVGQNYYASNVQSGNAQLGAAQTGGRGSVQQDALEQSNVSVSQEFARLIIAQQAYEANSRTISVSSQVVQDLMSIFH